MATPVFRSLRANFPDARITLCLRPHLVSLIAGAKWYDNILIYDKKRLHKGLLGWWRFLRTLRSKRYHLGIVLPSSFRSGLIAWLSRARIRVGYDRFGGCWMLTRRATKLVENSSFVPEYMGYYYGVLSSMVGSPVDSMSLELPLTSKVRDRARKIWEKTAGESFPKILIAPGAAFGSSKLWPTDYFARIVELLGKDFNAKMLISPGPGEEEIAHEIRKKANWPVRVIPASCVNLEMLKGLISKSDLLLCNDTGPRHIAHAFNIPVVVPMGSTDPRYSEIDIENAIVLRHEVSCSPCHLKKCPIEHPCMTGITPNHLYQAVKKQLGKSRN